MTSDNDSQWLSKRYVSRRAALRAGILGAAIPGILYVAKSAGSADAADGDIYIPGAPNFLELGHGWPGKEANAGKITYQKWSDALDIVGAGTAAGYRKVKIWDDLYVQGLLNLRSYVVDPVVPPAWTAFLYAKNVNGQSKPFWKDTTGTAQPLVARSATLIVAASDASPRSKLGADYVCDGIADEVEINAAIAALPAAGGKVVLSEGTFNIAATIDIDRDSVALEGQGRVASRLIGATGLTTAVIKVHKDIHQATVRSLHVSPNSIAGVSGIYFEATAAPTNDPPWNCWLENLDIRNATTSCYAIKADSLYQSVFNNIFCHNVANGLLWNDIVASLAGNSRIDSFYVLLNQNNGVGIEINGCEHISGSRWQVLRSASETGLIGIKLYAAHHVHVAQINLEQMSTCIQVDGSDGGSGGSHNVTFDTGYIQSADNAGKGIYVTANAVRSNFLRLGIQGTTGGTSIGIEDNAWPVGHGSRYRDCLVQGFDTLVSRVTGNTSTFSNVTGYVTENSGTATIASGITYSDVAHGLSATPYAKDISVTPTNNLGSASKFWISNVGASTFRINVNTSPGPTTATFAWRAEVL